MLKRSGIIILLISFFISCSTVAGNISSVSDRKDVMKENLEKFSKNYYWKKFDILSLLIDPDSSSEILEYLHSQLDKQKIAGVDQLNVTYSDDAMKATTELDIKYFDFSMMKGDGSFHELQLYRLD